MGTGTAQVASDARVEPAPKRSAAVFLLGAVVCFVLPPLASGTVVEQPPAPAVLVAVAVAELLLAVALMAWWLHRRGASWSSLGLTSMGWRRDALLAVLTVPPRLLLDFAVLVPASGGAANPEIQEVLRYASDGVGALAATLVLGVVGGGIAEELYFRGFLMGSLPTMAHRPRRALWIAAATSVLLFAVLHLPANLPDTASILVAAAVYTWLFLHTRRLVAPILAHSLWNVAVTFTVLVLYG